MKKSIFILFLGMILCLSTYSVAQQAERITREGTIQGLESACAGVYCPVGQENLMAAVE